MFLLWLSTATVAFSFAESSEASFSHFVEGSRSLKPKDGIIPRIYIDALHKYGVTLQDISKTDIQELKYPPVRNFDLFGIKYSKESAILEVEPLKKDGEYLGLIRKIKLVEKLKDKSKDIEYKIIKMDTEQPCSTNLISYDGKAFKVNKSVKSPVFKIEYQEYREKMDVIPLPFVIATVHPRRIDYDIRAEQQKNPEASRISINIQKTQMLLAYFKFLPDAPTKRKNDGSAQKQLSATSGATGGQFVLTPLITKERGVCKDIDSTGSDEGMGFLVAERNDVQEVFMEDEKLVIKMTDKMDSITIKVSNTIDTLPSPPPEKGSLQSPPKGFGCN